MERNNAKERDKKSKQTKQTKLTKKGGLVGRGFTTRKPFPSFHLSPLVFPINRLPPGKDLDGWWTLLRSGLWRLNFQLSKEGKKRYYDEILPLLHDTKASVLGDRDHDAWYLVYLGTKPNSQGRGYARALLEDMIRRVS